MEFTSRQTDYWRSFFSNRYTRAPITDDDLMLQTDNTVNKVPIPLSAIQQRAHRIASILQLSPQDDLVDLCCGNGLVDFELAPYVKSILGIDFAENLIDAARRLKQRPNIRYCIGNVTAPFSLLMDDDKLPGKFTMVGALGCFQPCGLDEILGNIVRHLKGRAFQFLIVGIPNVELRGHFYDTPERVARHLENERAHPDTNDGIGRWWRAEEIETICSSRGLLAHLTNHTVDGTNYRMDALIRTNPGGPAE